MCRQNEDGPCKYSPKGLFKTFVHCLLFVLQNIKLSSIKVDTRYTTTQQVVKLVGSHTISKVTVKIGDLKRTKMVRTINLYYNNRTVQAIVELKNKYVLRFSFWPLPQFYYCMAV